jgi:DsbC/DsbD-like thiol-disulfide interchange protein
MKAAVSLRVVCVSLAVLASLAAGYGRASAQTPPSGSRSGSGPHVRVELIADRVRPGHGMTLGLKFDLDKDWHIYWLNPGDSGGPPAATWTLPPGMMAAGIEWPAPERIDIGGLVNYGYHDSVVLPVAMAIAADARMPPLLAVKTSVRWMACANLCVPGKADLELRFPLGSGEQAHLDDWKTAIDDARRRVPTPAPASWTMSASSTVETFVVDVLTGSREVQAVFFPLDLSQVNDSAAQIATPLPNGVRLTLVKSSQLTKEPARLRGVITLPGGRSHTIEAAVR